MIYAGMHFNHQHLASQTGITPLAPILHSFLLFASPPVHLATGTGDTSSSPSGYLITYCNSREDFVPCNYLPKASRRPWHPLQTGLLVLAAPGPRLHHQQLAAVYMLTQQWLQSSSNVILCDTAFCKFGLALERRTTTVAAKLWSRKSS